MRVNKRKRLKKDEITANRLFDLNASIVGGYFSRSEYPFEVLRDLKEIIIMLSKTLDSDFVEIKPGVFVNKSVKFSTFSTIEPPCIICENAEIRSGALIRGSVVIGKNCVVGNSTEIKNAVLFDGAKAPHYNYIGDSVMGKNSHLGAGGILSNLRLDKKNVRIKTVSGYIETGLKKLGSMIGDNAEIGCNSVLNPGCVVRKGEIILPLSCVT